MSYEHISEVWLNAVRQDEGSAEYYSELAAWCEGLEPGDQRRAWSARLEEDAGGHAERNRGQHLVGDAKQGPQDVDPTRRINDADVQKITPGSHEQAGKRHGNQTEHDAAEQGFDHG